MGQFAVLFGDRFALPFAEARSMTPSGAYTDFRRSLSNPKALCPLDKVDREFKLGRPNALWEVDFTYVHTWTLS